jgi:hypothetical protein
VRVSRNEGPNRELREQRSPEVPVLVPCPPGHHFPPDLARVAALWPDLPDAIKAGVLALVEAAQVGDRRSIQP